MQSVKKIHPILYLLALIVIITIIKLTVPGFGKEAPYFLYAFALIFAASFGVRYVLAYTLSSIVLINVFFQQEILLVSIFQYIFYTIVGVVLAKIFESNKKLIQQLNEKTIELEKANKKLKVQNDRIIELMDQALDYSPDRKRTMKKE